MSEQQLPETDSVEELARFWQHHDLTDFEDELEVISERLFRPRSRNPAGQMLEFKGLVYEEQPVSKHEDLLKRILSGVADANIRFDDLRGLLQKLGFVERTRGSHHIFRRAGIQEKINIQPDGNKTKPYQVRQVRAVILRYKLAGEL